MYAQQELIDKLTTIFKRFPIKRAALFGSYARNEQKENPDLDIVLELNLTNTNELPDIIYVIWDELEGGVNLKADVLTFESLDTVPRAIRSRILTDLRYIYEV